MGNSSMLCASPKSIILGGQAGHTIDGSLGKNITMMGYGSYGSIDLSLTTPILGGLTSIYPANFDVRDQVCAQTGAVLAGLSQKLMGLFLGLRHILYVCIYIYIVTISNPQP